MTGITLPMLIDFYKTFFSPKMISPILNTVPSIGIAAVSFIIATIVAKNSTQILNAPSYLPLLCCFLITLFLTIGYLFSKLIKCKLETP